MHRIGWTLALAALGAGALLLRAQEPGASNVPHAMVIARQPTVIYRGEGVLQGSQAVVALPEYFDRSVRGETASVQLTCKGGWSPLWASPVLGGRFTVSTTRDGNASQAFWWEVKAEYLEGR